jgi:hypothetical protein
MDTLRGTFGSGDYADDHRDYDPAEDDIGNEPPPSPVGQDERRMQVRAYNHWASLLADRNFPSIEDLEPESLPDFGPFSVLLDFTSGIENPAIQYLGDKLAGECDAAGEIATLEDVPARSLLSRITDHYMQILANQAPIGFEAEFVNQRGLTILYRGILLPFSSDDDAIDFIYGVINWKEMADQLTTDELLLEIDQALDDDGDGASADEDDNAEDDVLGERAFEVGPRTPGLVTDWADGPANGDVSDAEEAAGGAGVANNAGVPLPGYALGGGDYDDEDEEGDWNAFGESAMPHPLFGQDDPIAEGIDDESLPSITEQLMRKKKPAEPLFSVPVTGVENLGEEEASWGDENWDESEDGEGGQAGDTGSSAPVPVPVPVAYEPDSDDEPLELTEVIEPEAPAEEPAATPEAVEIASANDEELGLYDALALAREKAMVARSSEDRTRNALYEAVGRAYDFSIAAQESPEDFEELVIENGLTVQDRAPMTPVVKLVFGVDYDKTRVTEYATALSHGHRLGIARGKMAEFLGEAEGGLKGVVKAERRLRREEAGKPVEPEGGPRAALAKKLRAIAPLGFEDLDDEGPEFGLVMIRRTEEGKIVVLGELPEDIPLIEKAARRLVA